MTTFVILGGGLFFLATAVVGARLLLLARRNRTQPELLLGLAFFVGGTLGGGMGQYVLLAADQHTPETLGSIVFLYCLVSVFGMALYNAFTWRVFRDGTLWAALLVAGILTSGLAIVAWYGATGVFETGVQPPLQRCVMMAGSSVGPIWATVEAFRYYLLMKKRIALGLADPMVTNRFLLWGLGSLCASVIVLGAIPGIFLDPSHGLVQASLLNIGVLGTLASLAYALAFFPPASYTAWVQRAETDPA